MIIIGDKSIFAIEAEIETVANGWILGHIQFWFNGESCGNWSDTSDLKGSVSWLKDFGRKPVNRNEQSLIEFPKKKLFDIILCSAFGRNCDEESTRDKPAIANAFSRFYISHLGMSAFDNIDMILVENQQIQRCLWCLVGDDTIHDCRFPSGLMQRVACAFCDRFERDYAREMEIPKQ